MNQKLFFPDRKAIMIKFLVTVLLALIIFAPACMFVSKIFKLSDQAKDSFFDLIVKVSNAEPGSKGSFLLKMDKDTALMKFDKDGKVSNENYVIPNGFFIPEEPEFTTFLETYPNSNQNSYAWTKDGSDYKLIKHIIDYPKKSCKEKDCLVLCRDGVFEESEVKTYTWKNFDVQGDQEIDYELVKWDYICKQKIVLSFEDDVQVGKFFYQRPSSDDSSRRVLVKLENREGKVRVTFE